MADLKSIAAEIAASGNRQVFGITGSGDSLVLADELERAGVGFVRTHFEGSAAIMAATTGRLTGRAGVAAAIKGPGLANLVPGMAVAALDSMPMVSIVEAYPAGSAPSKAHKRLDQRTLVTPVAKGVRALTPGGPGFADMAAWAEAEIPAPVVIELAGAAAPAEPPCPAPAPVPEGDIGRALDLIAAARRPLVIAGTLAIRRGWGDRLARLGIPVFSTAAAKGVVDERLPQAAGVYTGVGLGLVPETTLLPKADLIVCLGLRPMEVLATKPFPAPAIGIEDAADVPGAEDFEFVAAVSGTAAGQVLDALSAASWGLDILADCLQAMHAHLADSVFLPAGAFAILADRLGPAQRMVMDTGYFCTIGEHVWKAPNAGLCLMSGQGRYMGTGVPMAIAAALVDRDRPTVAVLGDGGIGMYAAELRLAVEHRLPLLVVLMTDGRFGSIATRALKDKLTLEPLTMPAPSWTRIMEGIGLPASRAETPEALDAALAAWDYRTGPAYIEVAFAPEPYERMVAGIR